MASWVKLTHTIMQIMIFLFIEFGFPAQSEPAVPDPYRCSDNGPKCCPANVPTTIVDFKPETQPTQLRVRRPAHALSPEEAQKYEKAIALMRALPDNHPWNFNEQAKVHCAYCSGAYAQFGQNISFEIHSSWHFFTWHRAYLYFNERILGNLINDTSFALPFWNWDSLSGMSIPPIYRDNSSSLFNPTRYPIGLKFTDLGGCDGDNTPESLPKQRECNLQLMHRQFITGLNSSSLFYGSPYRAGDKPFPGSSPLENSPHGAVHIGTSFDMFHVTNSAFDPAFFAHHGNIDRLWAIWGNISENGSKTINDKDFLDAYFLFWDENMQFVRIFVRDILDTRKLGYVYEEVPLQWMNIQTVVERAGSREGLFKTAAKRDEKGEVSFPLVLSSQVSIKIKRKAGKEGETLVVSNIKLDGRDYVWFTVYVERVGGGRVEAGCFIHMKRRGDVVIPMVTKLQIGITKFIEEIGADGDDWVVVTLVARVGGDKVSIGGLLIE